MLAYSQFQALQPSKRNFKFKKLLPVDEQSGTYSEVVTGKKYFVTIFNNPNHFTIIYGLYKKNLFGNIAGFLKKKHQYYCFSHADGYDTLAEFIERHRGEKQLISELFCLQLIEQAVDAAKHIENAGFTIKVLTPFCLIMNENKNNQYRFTLKFPMANSLFEGLKQAVAIRQIEFCAPQILIMMDNEYELSRYKFSKSVLYSLGLILLFCFGYRIKSEERILALKKGKQFKIFLKAVRKQIKLFQQGKFISKLIKIMMEENQYVRDSIETFVAKMRSPHLESLRKFIFKPAQQPEKQAYIPTVYSDYSDQTRKSGLNKTIQIRLSSLSSSQNQTHQKSDHEGQVNSSSNPDYNFSLFATFKKSPESYKHHEEIKEVEERNDSKADAPSPIQIHLDWEEEDQQDFVNKTPKKEEKESYKPAYEFPEEDLRIQISTCNKDIKRKKQRFLYSAEQKNLKRSIEAIKKSSKSIGQDKTNYKSKEEMDIESKDQLQKQRKVQNAIEQSSKEDKYHIMIEEEPEIIKYSQNDYKIGPQPRLSRKKTSKNGNDLQDMTLIEEGEYDQEQNEQTEQKSGTNYEEIKMEFSKKSQAIFMTLLVNFLIYKIIDYFIQ